jgi:hypothetical protein
MELVFLLYMFVYKGGSLERVPGYDVMSREQCILARDLSYKEVTGYIEFACVPIQTKSVDVQVRKQ